MGVNDLIKTWKTGEISGEENSFKEGYDAAMDRCGNQLEVVADLCWHPVSEPPTGGDADELGHVLVKHEKTGSILVCPWEVVSAKPTNQRDGEKYFDQWARIRDVVLMPEDNDG